MTFKPRIDPDRQSGSLERLIVGSMSALAICFGGLTAAAGLSRLSGKPPLRVNGVAGPDAGG